MHKINGANELKKILSNNRSDLLKVSGTLIGKKKRPVSAVLNMIAEFNYLCAYWHCYFLLIQVFVVLGENHLWMHLRANLTVKVIKSTEFSQTFRL